MVNGIEEKSKSQQLIKDVKDLESSDTKTSLHIVQSFVETLNNDNTNNNTFFVSPQWQSMEKEDDRKEFIKGIIESVEKEGNQKTKWVIPVLNLEHWHLVFVDIERQSIKLCDSLNFQFAKNNELKEMGNTFMGEGKTTEDWDIQAERHFPQQKDDKSCGMFMMLAMICIRKKKP